MNSARPYFGYLVGIGMTLALGWPAGAQETAKKAVGLYTAVSGRVTALHTGQAAPAPVSLRGDVYFKDVIETQAGSRAKALFEDDSLLTIGEQSRVEVSEHVYDPSNNQRSTVLRLVRGKMRALVGKVFGQGSRYEVHTPTAVAAARGTYFVVWIEEADSSKLGMNGGARIRPVALSGMDMAQAPPGATGVANIGNSGNVGFTSGGQTVEVGPGTFSVAPPGLPPVPPVTITTNAPPGVVGAIQGTEQSDTPKQESPSQAAASFGATTGPGPGGPLIVPPPTVPPAPTGLTPPSPISGSGSGAISGTPGGNTFNPPPPSPPPIRGEICIQCSP